ncbi:hypothetical protein BASA83_013139 [Batrachochytrium salamandrivorans]|nr:hypothetical protein BASA83_013139 [Batrachochytrium salamandrivorans]
MAVDDHKSRPSPNKRRHNETPTGTMTTNGATANGKITKRRAVSCSSDSESDYSDIPIARKAAHTSKTSSDLTKKQATQGSEDSSDYKKSKTTHLGSHKAVLGSGSVSEVQSMDDAASDSDSVESADSDIPLSKKLKKSTPIKKAAVKSETNSITKLKSPKIEPKSVSSSSKTTNFKDSSSDDDDIPIAKKLKLKASTPAPATKGSSTSKKKKSNDSIPLKKPTGRTKAIKSEDHSGVDGSSQDASQKVKHDDGDEEDEENEYKWWLDQDKDTSVKWTTLCHNGPVFAPMYVPHGVQMKYNGSSIRLSPASEEVASFFAAVVGTDWGNNVTFQQNFFRDFLLVLKEEDPSCPIKSFSKCDFTPITEYLAEVREKKKNMTKEEKMAEKEAKAVIDNHHGWVYLDGRKEKVGNFRIEPPGLFRGRGEHPRTGSLKLRVQSEQVTLNIGADAKLPDAPPGRKWGNIVHDNTVTWLAMWKENVNDSFKYIFLAANSSLKGQSDLKKFEKARSLKSHVSRIRRIYTEELKDKLMANRQRATALYFIDRLALRAGNEKGDEEADTVGCCSLRFEHITLEPPNKVIFDFLGKDSIRYYNEVSVDDQVFKNIKIFKRDPKREGDPLFDRLSTTLLNKHLNKYMEGLTAKVFRTFNASHTFQEELRKTPVNGTIAEKLLAYNRANRQVAILCNHQRSVSKGHGGQIARMQDKILAVKYDLMKVKKQMLDLDPKLKRTRPELKEPESDLDDDFIKRHEQSLEEREAEKNQQKLEKENEKRKEEGLPLLKELPEKRVNAGSINMTRLENKYTTLCDRLSAQKTNIIDKDENKTTALGTSKINYIDPRISAAWCHKYKVPLDKIFNKSLREKFTWAMDADESWNPQMATVQLGLERVTVLLEKLGNPHLSLKVVHVAGTNGKGSVCSYIASVLRCSGFRTGSFTSPHLLEPRDSVRIDGAAVSAEAFATAEALVAATNDSSSVNATPFEKLTAVMFVLLQQQAVDYAVIEVGLGGLGDATNVIAAPLVAVLTCIGIDHVEFLGHSLAEIAAHKAGIIKHGSTVVVGPQQDADVQALLVDSAQQAGCAIRVVQPAVVAPQGHDATDTDAGSRTTSDADANTNADADTNADTTNGSTPATASAQIWVETVFCGKPLILPQMLPGAFQLENIAIAVAALDALTTLHSTDISPAAVVKGFRTIRLPGRLEWLHSSTIASRRVLLDGAHNLMSASALAEYVDRQRNNRPVRWIVGFTRGKDVSGSLAHFLRPNDTVTAVPFPQPQSMPWIFSEPPSSVAHLADLTVTLGAKAVCHASFADAWKEYLDETDNAQEGDLLVICGSLYLVADVYRTLGMTF